MSILLLILRCLVYVLNHTPQINKKVMIEIDNQYIVELSIRNFTALQISR
jgi:hypothetical protein